MPPQNAMNTMKVDNNMEYNIQAGPGRGLEYIKPSGVSKALTHTDIAQHIQTIRRATPVLQAIR